jgi:FkbM family methyltransferase
LSSLFLLFREKVFFSNSSDHNNKTTRMQLDQVFLDIGCGSGQRAAQWCDKYRGAMVFCFEPLKEAFELAQLASRKKPCDGRMHVFPVAISALSNSVVDGTKIPMYVANDASSTSMLPFSPEGVKRWRYPPGRLYFKTTETRQVPAMRIDKFLADRRIQRVASVRIETQGNTLDTLRSFGKRLRDVSEFIIKVHTTEYELYYGQTTKSELVDFMRRHGFAIYATRKYSRDQEEFIWFVNGKVLRTATLPHLDLEE